MYICYYYILGQFYFMNLNNILDYNERENIKDKIKAQLLANYIKITRQSEECLVMLSDEEFKNYIDIL